MRAPKTSRSMIKIRSLSFTRSHLTAKFSNGRTVSNPLKWYPRLWKATANDRNAFEFSGGGYGVHWERLDEDLSAKGIADGVPSIEYHGVSRP